MTPIDYILEWVNSDENEVYCKQVFGDINRVLNKIKEFKEIERKRDRDSIVVLVDSSGVIWNAKFLNYSVYNLNLEEDMIVFRVVFKVKKREMKNIYLGGKTI